MHPKNLRRPLPEAARVAWALVAACCGNLPRVFESTTTFGRTTVAMRGSVMGGIRGRVLIVDGNVDFAENVVEVLGEFGYAARYVVDPRDALALASDYDCIVSEHALPYLSGTEMIAALRARGCNVPVVILSSRVDTRLRNRALAAGAKLFLSKYGFEQWACALLNELERMRRPASGFMRKVSTGSQPSTSTTGMHLVRRTG